MKKVWSNGLANKTYSQSSTLDAHIVCFKACLCRDTAVKLQFQSRKIEIRTYQFLSFYVLILTLFQKLKYNYNNISQFSSAGFLILYVPDVICYTSVYYTKSLTRYASFSQNEPPWAVDALTMLWVHRPKMSFPTHKDTLLSSKTEPRVNNLAVANLPSYPLSYTATSWDDSVERDSQRMQLRYVHCWHQTTNLTISIRRCNTLSYVTALSWLKMLKSQPLCMVDVKKNS